MRNFLLIVTRNPVSLLGTAITTAAAILMLTLLALDLMGYHGGPYTGILAFLVLPGFFALGLVLIPIGMAWERRRQRRAAARGEAPPAFPVIDLNLPRTRRLFLTFLAATVVNLVILATATFKGVEVMDSTEFCGQACHSVMHPEFTTYQRSPHARVACVSCHIGPGADWFVKSKLSGAWQVVSVAFDLYPRPIPVPVENLRPARETCEQCHWPAKFVGDRLLVRSSFREDEANTETKTVMLMKVGGLIGERGHGIHWHVDPGIEIRYRSDASRNTIYEMAMRTADGTVEHFVNEGAGEPEGETFWRVMDCVDCHNRPSHIYELPEVELNRAMVEGRVNRTLPFIRREGLRALKDSYPSHAAAREGIAARLRAFYSEHYPEQAGEHREQLEAAIAELGEIWATNVFPAMKITWGTYPSHIGHEDTPGCFRCHTFEFATAEGRVVTTDCNACHSILALEEEDPPILAQLSP